MTQFERLVAAAPIVCDICGASMHPMYGGGWDNDRIVCADRECGAEIVYATSTVCPPPQSTTDKAHASDSGASAFRRTRIADTEQTWQ